ncbi:MAG: C25 family cysteine peptidase, partial [Brevefilum sp.]|nr:C25 family cysteine peptidase [Brevefilum sp.]
MMKTPRIFLSVIILLAMIGSPFFSATYDVFASGGDQKIDSGSTNSLLNQGSIIDQPAQIETDNPILLESSYETGLTFEVNVPWEQLNLSPITVDGNTYTQVSLPGWDLASNPGEPELPIFTSLIGVPAGAGIEVSVLPGRSHTYILGADVLPKVRQISNQQKYLEDEASWLEPDPVLVFEKDPEVYDKQGNYPGVLAEISQEGFLRQQRVAGVTVYPVQYNPASMEITVYETLRVTVNFTGGVTSRNVQQELDSDAYENLLSGTLLNYDAARDWRLSTEISASIQSDTQISTASWAPPVLAWRVKVREAGMYQLTYLELQNAGLPVDSLDPRSLQMFYLGNEVAIQVVGEEDGVFDQGDLIRFYGEEVSSKYTLDSVYWLTYGGTTQGLRMGVKEGSPGAAAIPGHYMETLRFEENKLYIPKANVDENWLWKQIYVTSSTTFTHTFNLTEPVLSPGVVRVSLLGYVASYVNPDHQVKVYINGIEVGEVFWDGITWQMLEATIPSGLLQAGENTIAVTALLQSGMSWDNIFLDWIELDYANTFFAESNHLAFGYDSPGTWKFNVDGFTSDQVHVYDVTNPSAVKRFTGVEINPTGLGYAVAFEDDITSLTNYFAVESLGYRQVQAIESDTPSNLQAAANGADHIIITPADFTAASTSLRDYRQSQGLRSMVVDVQDIYDEFSYGITEPAAIHDFLAYAYNTWSGTAPSYVVLMGDATYDPKNYTGYNTQSYIPAYLLPVDPWMGETAADNRYVTISGTDTMPDMMLGRISVNSAAEAQAFVNKIIEYESVPDGDWKNQVLSVADNMDAAGDFASLSENLLSCCFSEDYSVEKIYYGLSPYTDTTVTQNAIKSSINAGKFLVNYIGHGATASWAGESLFHSNYVPSLTNAGKYLVAVVMACMEGYYIRPQTTLSSHAVGEVFTRAVDKGAIASWSATGEGVASGHTYLNQGFFNAVFQQNASTVGEATLAGKLNLFSVGASPDLLDTYLLFGDPATLIGQQFRAVDDAYSTTQDTPLTQAAPGVLSNDIYSGEGSLSAVLVNNPTNGGVTLNANGSFTYTPSSGFTGTDSFTYYASDGALDSNIATVTITVTASDLNQAPVLDVIGDKSVNELAALSFTATASDPDLPANTLTFSLEGAPTNASINPSSGAFSWTPTEAQGPGAYTFTVKVCDDGTPILCDTEEITVTVNELNQPPVLGAIGDKTVDELSTLSFTATASDSDLPANALTFSLEGAPIGASIDPVSGA